MIKYLIEEPGGFLALLLLGIIVLLIVTRKRRRRRRAARVANRSLQRYTPQPISNWVCDYLVDDFGDLTGNTCVRGTFQGTFSNSATSCSALTVYIYLDPKHPSRTMIRLFEYGIEHDMKASFHDSDTITLKTKDLSGKISSYPLKFSKNSGDLLEHQGDLASEIRNNSLLSIVITASSEYRSVPIKYVFKVDNYGLSALLK